MSNVLDKYHSLPKEEVKKCVNARAKLMESVNKIQIEELKKKKTS